MKKAMLMVSGLLVSTAFVPNLFAESPDAITTLDELKTCLTSDSPTCTLSNRIEIKSTDGEVTLDLNGKTVTRASGTVIYVTSGGNLTLTGEGSIKGSISNSSPVYVDGSSTLNVKGSVVIENTDNGFALVADSSEVNISENASIINSGDNGTGLSILGTNPKLNITGGTVSANGGAITMFGTNPTVEISAGTITSKNGFAISGNGSSTTNSTITISGGDITSVNNVAIYNPQSGSLEMTNGTVTGGTLGIVARQGDISITGGKVEAKGEVGQMVTTGDNATELPSGVAIAVDNVANYGQGSHQDATVNVSGTAAIRSTGTPLYTTKADPASGEKSTEIVVDGGEFNNDVPDQFLKTGNSQSESGKVGIVHNVKVQENAKNGAVSSVQTAVEGEEVTVNAVPEEGYELSKIVVTDAEGNEVTVTNGKFIMPTSDVTVSATFVAATNPQTGDNILTYVFVGLVSMLALGFGVKKLSKNN